MADVDGSSAGTYYKYKGEINYASAAKLNIYVEGYYVSNGTYRLVTNEKTVASQKSATVYAYVPGGKLAYPPKTSKFFNWIYKKFKSCICKISKLIE